LKLIYSVSFLRQKPRFPQKLSHKFTSNIKPLTSRILCIIFLTTLFSLKAASQAGFRPSHDTLPVLRLISVLPQNFYNQHKGYVCKKEDLLQKATGLNLFIRLGSKSYVDYMEQKPNAIKPN
jgi:hypothetical protein